MSLFNHFSQQINNASAQTKVQWCWTKSMVNEPSFVLDAKNGGMNWGYCVQEKKAPPVKFYAVVETSTLTHSDTK